MPTFPPGLNLSPQIPQPVHSHGLWKSYRASVSLLCSRSPSGSCFPKTIRILPSASNHCTEVYSGFWVLSVNQVIFPIEPMWHLSRWCLALKEVVHPVASWQSCLSRVICDKQRVNRSNCKACGSKMRSQMGSIQKKWRTKVRQGKQSVKRTRV